MDDFIAKFYQEPDLKKAINQLILMQNQYLIGYFKDNKYKAVELIKYFILKGQKIDPNHLNKSVQCYCLPKTFQASITGLATKTNNPFLS